MIPKHLPSSPLLTLLLTGIFLALSFGSATTARAELRRYILEYANTSGTKAQARGYIVIDDAVLLNPGTNVFPGDSFVKDIQITISKATEKTHNGTFTASDFTSVEFVLEGGGTVDLSQDLIGQTAVSDIYVCNSIIATPAPNCPPPLFSMQTGGADSGNPADGDIFELVSCRPMTTTSARVYKCTMSLKGSYKYCDQDFFGQGDPRWVCKKYRRKASYYMTIDPVGQRVSFLWLDPKTKTFDIIAGYALPDLKFAQCRLPSTSAPAGKWEAWLPLWCHIDDINIDFDTAPNLLDATRCRIACLTGVESLRTFTYNDNNTEERVRLKDHAVARLKGGFSQTTQYDTLHYAFNDPKKDRVLGWQFATNNPGDIRTGGGFSCITGTISCRLDTRLTSVALSNEAEAGTGVGVAEDAVFADLIAKGWTIERGTNHVGAPLTLQPDGLENLEPLIP